MFAAALLKSKLAGKVQLIYAEGGAVKGAADVVELYKALKVKRQPACDV